MDAHRNPKKAVVNAAHSIFWSYVTKEEKCRAPFMSLAMIKLLVCVLALLALHLLVLYLLIVNVARAFPVQAGSLVQCFAIVWIKDMYILSCS